MPDTAALKAAVEQGILTLQNMILSPYSSDIREEAESWASTLHAIGEDLGLGGAGLAWPGSRGGSLQHGLLIVPVAPPPRIPPGRLGHFPAEVGLPEHCAA